MVVDASVALKWVVAEPDTPQALALLRSRPLIAPDLLLYEVANVLWLRVKRGPLAARDAPKALAEVRGALAAIASGAELVESALALSIALAHPAYDCIYLALAEREELTMVTADDRLWRAVQATAYQRRVMRLADLPLV